MNTVDHNNVVIFDDRGIPSIMCRFVRPKDTEEVPAVFNRTGYMESRPYTLWSIRP